MSRQPPPKPDVSITPKPRKPSEWSPRPVPQPGPGRSTEDPRTPTLRELAAREARRASMVAEATGVAVRPDQIRPAVEAEPQTLAAKKERLAKRRSLIQSARQRAAGMPPGPERSLLLATAARFEDDTRAVDRMRLAKHVYDYYREGTPPPIGFDQLTGREELAKLGLTPEDLAPKDSNFRAAIYRSQLDPSAKPIAAFRGTIMDSVEDWKNNVRQGAGLPAAHYERALYVGGLLADATEDTGGFETVGHSLGGGMASAVSAKYKVRGDTFNAAGVSESTLRRVQASRADGAPLLNAYNVDGEILTAIQDRNNQRGAFVAGAQLPGIGAAATVAGLAREIAGNRVLPDALGRKRTIPAVDAPKYQGWGALNPAKFVDRHLSPTVIAGFEEEKSLDSRALGLAVR